MIQKILAVDDEPDLLRLLERIIREKTTYEIKITGNPLEVPTLLEAEEFDVIITDLKMPGMDGLDILKYISDNKRNEQVIIITAFGSLDTAMDALTLGVFDYITKPFRKEQIIATVDKAMKYQKMLLENNKFKTILEIETLQAAIEEFEILFREFHASE
jgi:DNA-binding NtrC family response regulator